MANNPFHSWAHQIPNRKGELYAKQGNVFYKGATIFSYGTHFPMASWVTNAKGQRAVLFTTRDYSVTTRSHKGITRRSIPDDVLVFRVPDAPYVSYGGGSVTFGRAEMREAFEGYIREARELCAKATKARKHGDAFLRDAEESLQIARDFCAFFGLRWKIPTMQDVGAEALPMIRAWQANEPGAHLPGWNYRRDDNGSAYLRTNGENVETSQGAEVPLSHAIRVYRFVKLCRATGQPWQSNGHTLRVGHYTFESIDTQGNARIGCHYLTWERISEWAASQGIADAEVSTEALVTTENVQ